MKSRPMGLYAEHKVLFGGRDVSGFRLMMLVQYEIWAVFKFGGHEVRSICFLRD